MPLYFVRHFIYSIFIVFNASICIRLYSQITLLLISNFRTDSTCITHMIPNTTISTML